MKKLLFITFISFLWCNISKANDINLVCVNTHNPDFIGSVIIYQSDKKISFNGGPPSVYFLENGVFKYILKDVNETLTFRHSLNRNSGMLSVNTYELTDEQVVKHTADTVEKIMEADKLGDRNYWAKVIHRDLANYKSTFDGFFNCDTAKSKF